MKRMLAVFAMIATTVYSMRAQHIAKYGGEFLSLGVGGRALAMGGAYVAAAHDVYASYWNPAALACIEYPEIALMHEERFAGLLNYDFGSVAVPLTLESTLGVSLLRLGVDNIADTRLAGIDIHGNPVPPDEFENAIRLDYSKITYFTAASWALYLTYAQKESEKFSYGINVKLIRHSFASASALGIGFDLALLYLPTKEWLLGVNAQDITTTLIAWSTGTNELISPTLKVGTAYRYSLFGGTLMGAADVDIRAENRRRSARANIGPVSFDPHLGIEYDYNNIVAIRAGYSDIKQLTLGAGLHLRKIDLDYAFARFGQEHSLGNTHRISLRIILQEERFARK